MNTLHKQIAALAVLMCVVSGAWGQIVPVQDGRALDSNYRIGGSTVNSPTSQQTSFSSQMYITGQVTGLGAFRGETGYFADNQLRLNVPSAGLSGFRRQSVGLSDVLSGQTYRTGVYYDRSNTALGVKGISQGLTATGTNVPRSSHLGGIVPRKAMDEAMSDFRPLLGNRVGGALSSDIRAPIKLDAAPPRIVGALGTPTRRAAPRTFGAGELAVFTVSRPSQRSDVDIELRELEQLEQDDITRIDSKLRGPTVVPPRTGADPAAGGLGIASQAARESDVFLTMIYMLQQQHLQGDKGSEPKTADPDSGDPRFTLKPLGPRPGSLELVEQGLRGELVFNTLAGKGSDAFNLAMRTGEKELKAGRFYSAVDQYRLAVRIQPANPTTRLGLAAALFGAGESLGASLQLRRAMRMFPPVMVTRLNVMREIPSKKLKGRLEQIYNRIKDRQGANVDPQLAMLATYMHRSAGENYIAEVCAKKLKAAAGDDKIYSAFATYVLTGKRPAALGATTRPAPSK